MILLPHDLSEVLNEGEGERARLVLPLAPTHATYLSSPVVHSRAHTSAREASRRHMHQGRCSIVLVLLGQSLAELHVTTMPGDGGGKVFLGGLSCPGAEH